VNGIQKQVLRGVRLRYEGTLSPALTLFAAADYTSANERRAAMPTSPFDPEVIGVFPFPGVPRVAAEVGVQYLSRDGWFVQPSVGYIGRRARYFADNSSLGGATIVNARVGRRLGLHFSGFIEAVNLLDKRYIVGAQVQSDRQFRLGVVQRF
jgi:outer membrane receptor protein involved in Fe transport